MSFKMYSISYKYRGNWLGVSSYSKKAILEFISENQSYNFGEVEESYSDYIYSKTSNPYNKFIEDGSFLVGRCHLDSRCTGEVDNYGPTDKKNESVASFNKIKSSSEENSNRYYSQKWV